MDSYKTQEQDEDGPEVIAANLLDDPLVLAQDCRTFKCKSNQNVILRHYKFNQLSKTLLLWALDLNESNMSDLYNKCSWGWNRKKKKKEMLQKRSRYLIAFMDDKPVAFLQFQFDMDYGRQVIYCYEIQLDISVRSLHLGLHLMKTLEILAAKTCIQLIVLTALKHNHSAFKFFQEIGYGYDESNLDDELEVAHVILSKKICEI